MSKIVKTVNVKKQNKQTQSATGGAKSGAAAGKVTFKDFWDVKNIIFLVVGIISLIIGFYLMSVPPWDSSAALNYSPLFLLAAYLIFFPVSILIKNKK